MDDYDGNIGFPVREKETLTNKGPPKTIDQLNDDAISSAISKMSLGPDKVIL